MKLKHVARSLAGGTPDTEDPSFWTEGTSGTPWVSISDMSGRPRVTSTTKALTDAGLASRRLAVAPAGTVLFAMYASVGEVSTLAMPAVWNQALLGLMAEPARSESRFLAYWLQHFAPQAVAQANSATQANLGADQVMNFPFPNLGVQEQRRIADFLDDRVARIDQIIAGRRQQASLAQEAQQCHLEALLRAETDRVRAGRVLTVLPGYAFPSEGFTTNSDDIRLVRGVNVTPDGLRWDDTVYWPEEDAQSLAAFRLGAGDLILGMDRPWIGSGLRIAMMTPEDGAPLLLQRVAKLTPQGTPARFIYWAYRSDAFRAQVEATLTGLSVPHLSGDQIASYEMPWPSINRQEAIARELDEAAAATAVAVSSMEAGIGLLQEYKQSLITAAVTGELDVTTASSRIPE